MQGKIEYDGDQSLFYRSATHIEDCELTTDKFIHTSAYPDRPEYTSNGTDIFLFNKNDFKKTSRLKYHTEFSLGEISWEKYSKI